MLNLIPFTEKDSFLLHTEILDSKNDRALVQQLLKINGQIQQQFDTHTTESATNTLEDIQALDISEDQKINLRKLYNARSKHIIKIKNSITTSPDNRIINLCQYCTINTVSPMDHIMPKGEFPEFSVHAKNLFPCCSECNSHKSNTWVVEGHRQFLNLYLDILPSEQYLFVNITNLDNIPSIYFYLDNRNNINEELFRLITSHFNKLNLLKRFELSSHEVIADIKYSIEALLTHLTTEEITTIILETATKKMSYYGTNYWKCMLEIALGENSDFVESCNIT